MNNNNLNTTNTNTNTTNNTTTNTNTNNDNDDDDDDDGKSNNNDNKNKQISGKQKLQRSKADNGTKISGRIALRSTIMGTIRIRCGLYRDADYSSARHITGGREL